MKYFDAANTNIKPMYIYKIIKDVFIYKKIIFLICYKKGMTKKIKKALCINSVVKHLSIHFI